jgi:hypothetical protein
MNQHKSGAWGNGTGQRIFFMPCMCQCSARQINHRSANPLIKVFPLEGRTMIVKKSIMIRTFWAGSKPVNEHKCLRLLLKDNFSLRFNKCKIRAGNSHETEMQHRICFSDFRKYNSFYRTIYRMHQFDHNNLNSELSGNVEETYERSQSRSRTKSSQPSKDRRSSHRSPIGADRLNN